MAVELGIVGLPNVGKSTLFNALTRAHAAVAPYPFTTIEPNVGVVSVPDERLQRITQIVQPEKTVPSTLRVVDIAGLVEARARGRGWATSFWGTFATSMRSRWLCGLFRTRTYRTFRQTSTPLMTSTR